MGSSLFRGCHTVQIGSNRRFGIIRGPIFNDQADYLNFEDTILDSPETSVRNCHSALRNSTEERRNVTLF